MKAKFLIVDGYGLIFRSYYALANNKGGGSTLSVFFSALNLLMRETNCSHLCVALDSKGPTFRHELFADYKANREKTPEELHQQIDVMKEILRSYKIKTIEAAGLEADDIIAGLVSNYKNEAEITIASADKDLLQLIDDSNNVSQLRPDYKSNQWSRYTESSIEEHYGVKRGQIASYLSILGDDADNIPGVAGIGKTGAAKLLSQYKDLDDIYDNIDGISGAIAKKLEASRESARLSYKLILLDNSDRFNSSLEDFDINGIDVTEGTRALKKENVNYSADRFEKYLLSRGLKSSASGNDEENTSAICERVSAAEAAKIIQECQLLSVFIADDSLFFCQDEKKCHMVDFNETVSISLRARKNPAITYNAKEYCKAVQPECIPDDILIMNYVLNSDISNPSLEYLCEIYAGMNLKNDEDLFSKADPKTPVAILRAYKALKTKLNENHLNEVYEKIEKPLFPILAEMETKGITIDRNSVTRIKNEFGREKERLEGEIYGMCGREFNIQSPKQLQEVLIDGLKLSFTKKNASGYSMDAEVLEAHSEDHPVIQKILEYRAKIKLLSTYTSSLLEQADSEHSRLHTTFLQNGTATGRFSSVQPNLQNIPVRTDDGRLIRSCFIPKGGCTLLSSDYSQIELAILAEMSQDKNLCDFFKNKEDIHRATARFLTGRQDISDAERRAAKTINFAVIYGMSSFRLSKELGISYSEGKKFIESYFSAFPAVIELRDRTLKFAHENGYVETLCKRRRYFRNINSANKNVREADERAAFNSCIQGTAADMIKLAMIEADKQIKSLKLKASLLLTVHDELIFEVDDRDIDATMEMIEKVMTGIIPFSIPLRVSMEKGKNWGEIH